MNLSITTGIFPNSWKMAKVTPIFKEDAKTDPNNYRPISVLPVVSKLIERIVFKARFKRRTLHVPNLMQMRENNRLFSFALDSAHVKFDV